MASANCGAKAPDDVAWELVNVASMLREMPVVIDPLTTTFPAAFDAAVPLNSLAGSPPVSLRMALPTSLAQLADLACANTCACLLELAASQALPPVSKVEPELTVMLLVCVSVACASTELIGINAPA